MQMLEKGTLVVVALMIVFSLCGCGLSPEEAAPSQKPAEEAATEEKEKSIPERKTAAIKINYEKPELYLASGIQSSLDKKYSDEISTQITIESNNIKGIAEIFHWKQDHFSTYSAGGKFIGQITVNQIMEEKTLSGCHDHALVLVSVFREYGFPAIMVDTAGIQWASDYSEGKREDFAGHVFVEVYVNNSWVLINSTSGEYVEDYDPYNPVIPMTNSDEDIGYFALLKGLDPEEYGITSLQQLKEYLIAFAEEVRYTDMSFPQYDIKELPSSPILTSPLRQEDIELKYDDGTSEGTVSAGSHLGFLVHFKPPETPFAINTVKVFAILKGTGYENQTTWFEIWDKSGNVLHYWEKSATEFSTEPGWVPMELPDIIVNDDFQVVFYPYSTREAGVYLQFDSSQTNNHSEMASPGGRISDWIWSSPKGETNWMIRVVGTPSTGTAAAPVIPFQEIEGTAEFRETVSSLDNPEKLSQWMIENIKGESYYEKEKESGASYTSPPEETFETRIGNCRVFAVFACYILEYHGYEAEILSIKVASDESMNHVVCAYRSDGSLYVINNGRMEGPYQNYEDIASAHHEGWSSYEITHSWDKYQRMGPPDKVVDREQ